MSTAAVITLVLSSLLVVGGLLLSVASAVRSERAERRGGR